MDQKQFLEYLTKIYEIYYDLNFDYSIANFKFDLYARYFERNERYIATKKVVIYGIERNEHMLYKYYEKFDIEDCDEFIESIVSTSKILVIPGEDHMSTLVRGVVACEDVSEDAIKKLKKFKYYKSFKLGIHGWVNIALNLVDIKDGKSYHNKMGKKGSEIFKIQGGNQCYH